MPKRNWRGRQMQGQWENRVGSILGTTLKIDMENHKKNQQEMLRNYLGSIDENDENDDNVIEIKQKYEGIYFY